jgi:hypothetical protein
LGECLFFGFSALRLLLCDEAFEGDAGCLLLGLLLGGAFGFGEGARATVAVGDADFDAEELLVIRAALCGKDVLRLPRSGGLEVFLESGLVIADGSGEGVAGAEGSVELRDGGLDDVALDEGACSVESAVEVEGGDDGFEGIGEEGGLLAASALLFSAAETEQGSEVDAFGDTAEVTAADERGSQAGELAFARVREAAEEAIGYGESEDGVADKLKLLVVGCGRRRGVGVGLVGEGAVREREGKKLGAAKAMLEEGRESLARCSSCGLSARCHADPLGIYFTGVLDAPARGVVFENSLWCAKGLIWVMAGDRRPFRPCRLGPGVRCRHRCSAGALGEEKAL